MQKFHMEQGPIVHPHALQSILMMVSARLPSLNSNDRRPIISINELKDSDLSFIAESDHDYHESDSDVDVDPLKSLQPKEWDPPKSTKDVLEKYLRKRLSKEERDKLIEDFPPPNVPVAQMPVVDTTIQHILNQKRLSTRTIHGLLPIEIIQQRMLDTVGPLAAVHAAATEANEAKKSLDPKSVLEAVNHALLFLGNANSTAIYHRQKLVLAKLNPGVTGLLSGSSSNLSSELFGTEVRKTIKDASEARKELGIPADRTPQSFRYSGYDGGRRGRGNLTPSNSRSFKPYDRTNRPRFGQRQAKSTPSFQPKTRGEHTELQIPNCVGGRLKYFTSYWKSITEDAWTTSTVQGYSIPFLQTPRYCLEHAPHIIGDHESLIDTEVKALLEKNAICSVETPYHLSQIFLVPKKDGRSFRPILNLKPLNKFLDTRHFKLESIVMIRDILQPGMWMGKLDLKDAYFTVPISKAHRKYLQFRWKGTVYQYKCLPFGLATAPYAFTKLTKPLVSHIRANGIRILIYLDDAFITDINERQTQTAIDFVKQVFVSAGFIINEQRSIFKPVQCLEYLGFVINSSDFTFSLPTSKCEKIYSSAHRLLLDEKKTPRKLAKFIGIIISTKIAVRICYTKIRACQRCLITFLQTGDWDNQMTLSMEATEELQWWIKNAYQLPPSPIVNEEASLVIDSDASFFGWGSCSNGKSTGGRWTSQDLASYPHINLLELYAALLALKCFVLPSTTAVCLRLDNKTAVAYLNKLGGTRSSRLNTLALRIWEWCLCRNVWVTAEYLPGSQNVAADWESRHNSDYSSWKLSAEVFQSIIKRYPCNVDLFADRSNNQLPNFWSWKVDPEAMGTDAFTAKWSDVKGYAFPPFCMIGRCVRKCREEFATIILIAPVWRNQVWYPLLLESCVDFPRLLCPSTRLLTDGHGNPHPLLQQDRLPLAVWKISGNSEEHRRFQMQLPAYSSNQYDQNQRSHTTLHGESSLAGVLHGRSIPFKQI